MECEKVKSQFPEVQFEPCCISCHDDIDTGNGSDLWFEIGGEDRNVCCAVERSIRKHRIKLDESIR
jgi:hypothetical protein